MRTKSQLCALAIMAFAAGAPLPMDAQQGEITSSFNPGKPILPSSQYTPDAPYAATVWVFNDGRRYNDLYYNQILGAPDTDANGRQWYDPEYELTDNDIAWQEAMAPFSSDDYYKGHKSFQWVVSEIMAEMYMRRTFTLESLPEGTIYLACGHDDAPAEWYINGVQIHTVSDGWNNDEYILLTEEQKSLLKTDGTENVLAVHVHQNWGGAFADCGLYEADMWNTTTLLNTVSGGTWDCKYYMLNYNSDIETAEECGWYTAEEDESDWIAGVGPFSNDENMFYITEWPSQARPILIRRHFNLTASDLENINKGAKVYLTCSYDENPVIYLNGTKIWSATGWNDNNYTETALNDNQKKLLHEGDNILAVSLMQGGGGGHIDYGMKIVSPYEMSGISLPETDKNNQTEADLRIFNLQGQYLGTSADNLPRGLYIKGGKKLILGQ